MPFKCVPCKVLYSNFHVRPTNKEITEFKCPVCYREVFKATENEVKRWNRKAYFELEHDEEMPTYEFFWGERKSC